MTELDSAVWANEPGWLQKKRQLAGILQGRFPKQPGQESWLKAWQEPATVNKAAGWLTHTGKDYVALPLDRAVNSYSEMLQENLMEKALFWQDGQLNATHLNRLDGGQFIYVPDHSIVDQPIRLKPTLELQNPHTVIIVGSGARVTIEETATITSTAPVFAGVEILIGTGAQVRYRQFNCFTCPRAYQAVHSYQARGSKLWLEYGQVSAVNVTTSLYSFLDGHHTNWTAQAAIKVVKGCQNVYPVLDGYGAGTQGSLQLWGITAPGANLQLNALKTGSGEPLQLNDQQTRLRKNEDLKSHLPANSWLKSKL